MGDAPEVIKIACPGCETQFRLKPKKGRLPKGPVPCPKCAESIPVVEENIRRKEGEKDGKPKKRAPQAHVFSKTSGDQADTKKSPTIGTRGGKTPQHVDTVDAEEDEFDHISAASGLTEGNPKSTFLGMGSALAAINSPGKGDGKAEDKTSVVDNDLLAKIRSESSVVDDDDDGQESGNKDHLRQTAENDALLRDTSEKPAVKADSAGEADNEGDEESAPGHQVLGKIKLKKKLTRRISTGKSSVKSEKSGADDAEATTDAKKPSLASLLKKARERKDKPGADADQDAGQQSAPSSADESGEEKFDRALDDLADETARAIHSDAQTPQDEPGATAPADNDFAQPSGFDSGDSSMIDLMRRRVAENQQPGAASERRGSGYIRLPTAEIQDVLGQGSYRLRVEDIVYEPIDKEGLTQLVKRGVLLGAEQIADADGDWMPITEHPVFHELRRKMAREAHDLLAQYGKPSASDDDADLPTPATGAKNANLPAPAKVGLPTSLENRAGDSDAEQAGGLDESSIPEIDAELDEEAEAAARELFADADEDFEDTLVADGAGAGAPPPMPASAARAVDEATPMSERQAEPAAASQEIDAAKPSKLRTWIPLLVAAGVVAVLGGLAVTPQGQSLLESVLGEEATAPADKKEDTEAAAPAEDEKPSDEFAEAVTAASTKLGEAAAVDTSDATLRESVANKFVENGEHARAARILSAIWAERQDDADLGARLTETLLEAGDYAHAREVAIEGLQLDSEHDFAALYGRAIAEDPELGDYQVVDVSPETHGDSVRASLEGKRVVIHLDQGGEHRYTFKPSQSGWERGWRTSIAAWRLCQLVACQFEVPHSQPARIDETSFKKLASSASGKATGRLSSLNWQSEGGNRYVYGVLQTAVDEPVGFPIEDLDLWRSWLMVSSSTDFSAPLAEALAPLKSLSADTHKAIMAHVDDQRLSLVAAQLSGVLVFDFLTNNWSRFQRGEENWGQNLHFSSNGLVSMINAGAFQPRASTRVLGRFRWTDRYSRDLVTSLRAMTREMVTERLFPDASAGEKARVEILWKQRQTALERIDRLTNQHGEKDVLAFE